MIRLREEQYNKIKSGLKKDSIYKVAKKNLVSLTAVNEVKESKDYSDYLGVPAQNTTKSAVKEEASLQVEESSKSILKRIKEILWHKKNQD